MPATAAEVKLIPLKNCFVNLPRPLVAALNNSDAVIHDVVVELQFRGSGPGGQSSDSPNAPQQHSIYAGWTGMASAPKPTATGDRRRGRDDGGCIEIDDVFGRLYGLTDRQKVGILLHLDPPQAHTINVEPLTHADWEIIELHSAFLESNLLFQVRALSNPAHIEGSQGSGGVVSPLVIHLSPTSTARIVIKSIEPPVAASIPFAKIAPDAEVIVAPKERRPRSNRGPSSKSAASNSVSGAGARNSRVSGQSGQPSPNFVLLRAIDRGLCTEHFAEDDEEDQNDASFTVWIDESRLRNAPFTKTEWVKLSIIKPGGIDTVQEGQQQQRNRDVEASEAGRPATRLIARLNLWWDAPDSNHAALSSSLCRALEVDGILGGLVRLEPAVRPCPPKIVQKIRIFPFRDGESITKNLRIGPTRNSSKEAPITWLKALANGQGGASIWNGPLTDGMLIFEDEKHATNPLHHEGAILRISTNHQEFSANTLVWCFGADVKSKVEIQKQIANPLQFLHPSGPWVDLLPKFAPKMVAIDDFIHDLATQISYCSSVLITGGTGSGKTSLAISLANQLRFRKLFHVSKSSCSGLVTDETRIAAVQDVLTRLFMQATWGTKLGGKSLVILDDLDKLCPVETELQTLENSRSRHISEILCSLVRKYCAFGKNVVLLATAQSKENVNNVVIGGNVFKEITELKSPNKKARQKILQTLCSAYSSRDKTMNGIEDASRSEDGEDEAAWMDRSSPPSPIGQESAVSNNFSINRDLDFLAIAHKTDGYMPADMILLISRAKHEALIRKLKPQLHNSGPIVASIELSTIDFDQALENFTPSSLRSIPLQTSNITFSSIGGLDQPRHILLETLQYPTLYAPLFAQAPLRLRSGLLLYGFPGCGKTLLASAVAGECGLNFISVKGPEILNKYIGASEKSVRDLFTRAQAARPCVLFFDEFDSIAPKRGHDSTGVTDRVVNQLLTQMDGAEGLVAGVYVLAATSRPDLIDPALLRPGRLDKTVLCDMPSEKERWDILRTVSQKLNLSSDINVNDPDTKDTKSLRTVAQHTKGYSGADLQAILSNAQLEAIHAVINELPAAKHKSAKASQKSKAHTKQNRSKRSPEKASKLPRDITAFTFGAPDGEPQPLTATEKANIERKLDSLALLPSSHHSSPASGASSSPSPSSSDPDPDPDSDSKSPLGTRQRNIQGKDDPAEAKDWLKKPMIHWEHIQSSLQTTQPSVSAFEREKLRRVYAKFVEGRREGKMEDGEGVGRDAIGGRVSLM